MALLARTLPGLSGRPAFAPRCAVRSCRVRACLQPSKRQQTQQKTQTPADPLQQSSTQLAGAVGLLYPWLMAEAATAATPDGEHLTKVNGRCFREVVYEFC